MNTKFFYTVHRKNIQSRQDFSNAVQLHIGLGYKITWQGSHKRTNIKAEDTAH